MPRLEFILFFLILNISGVVAQATPDLFLPKQQDDVVKLKISYILDTKKEVFDYTYLAVFVKNETDNYTSKNAIQGRHSKEKNYLTFKPFYPFENGMTYIIRIKNTNSNDYLFHSFQIDKKKKLATSKVKSIFPSSNQLPENIIRFYIYFNTPMKKGEALKHIQLIDAEGKNDAHAFMQFKEELWSGDDKRLTLLFDPGRIKRGVATNMLQGPALQENKKYILKILDTWEDVYGQQLVEHIIKNIEIEKAYRSKIEINEWSLNKPIVNSHGVLTIHFDRIMDHALIQSMIQLKDEKGKQIDGYWEIVNEEQQLQFIPDKKWTKGNYKILVDTRLEDLAGNNLQNLLDHNKTDEDNTDAHQIINFQL